MSNAAIVQKLKNIVKSRAPSLVKLLKTAKKGEEKNIRDIFIPRFRLYTRSGTYTQHQTGWGGKGHTLLPQNVEKGTPVEFSLQVLHEDITGIDLTFGTHGRVNSCSLVIEVFVSSTASAPLVTRAITAQKCVDNAPFHILIGAATKVGDWLIIRVSSPDASPSNMVALWGSSVPLKALRHSTTGIPHCVDVTARSHSLVADLHTPHKEEFFPRFTASCFPNETTEHVIGWNGRCYPELYVPVLQDSPVSLSFHCGETHLTKAIIRVTQYGAVATGIIKLRLLRWQDNQWSEVRSVEIHAVHFPAIGGFGWEFHAIEDSKDSWFKLEISAAEANCENCIGIQGTVVSGESYAAEILPRLEDGTPSMTDEIRAVANPFQSQGTLPRVDRILAAASKGNFKAAVLSESAIFEASLHATCFTFSKLNSLVTTLSKFHLLYIEGDYAASALEQLFIAAQKLCVMVIIKNDLSQSTNHTYNKDAVLKNQIREITSPEQPLSKLLLHGDSTLHTRPNDLYYTYTEQFPDYRKKRLPSFSIISILYNKSAEIDYFLDCIAQQTYPGPIELLLVDDRSPDDSVAKVNARIALNRELFGEHGRIPVRILHNEQNIGNCGSRNRALQAASHDIAVIVDADCLLNKDFIAVHAAGHGVGDCDVVIGPYNLETNGHEPTSVLAEYEATPGKALSEAELQDPVVPQSFLNCITRNFSIRRDTVKGVLFDERFAYSSAPDSGFGWEDVEMGYRLFQEGKRIKFVQHAFSIHISHPSSCNEGIKPLKSLLNFRRLLETHPQLKEVAQRWVYDTYQKICAWIESSSLPRNHDREWLEAHLYPQPNTPLIKSSARRLKILTYRWHCPHQYEIYKLPHDFTLLNLAPDLFTASWEYDQRPFRENVRFKRPEEIRVHDYDLAILHFDENVLRPENTNDTLGGDWGDNFKWFRENVSLPMVAICHGTPQFKGQYNFSYREPDLGQILNFERQELVEYLKDIPVVCNSHEAFSEWNFQNSRVIWHGFDPMEFGPMTTGHGILTLGKAMAERPVYRGFFLFQDVLKHLAEDIPLSYLKVPRPSFDYKTSTNEYAWAKFRLYVQEIRKYSVYFNPTLRSPMPRSRGEAMMCGVVPVCADTHDVSRFLTNGVDGFFSNDPKELADMLTFLYRNPDKCRAIGQKSRETASKVFNIQRFHADWTQLLSDAIGNQ